MNNIFVIGRLTAAPELRQTESGVNVCTFTIGVNRRMNKENSDFFPIVTWRGLADTCAQYLQKGQQVAVTGRMECRTYNDKNGKKQYFWEIQADNVEFLAKAQEK